MTDPPKELNDELMGQTLTIKGKERVVIAVDVRRGRVKLGPAVLPPNAKVEAAADAKRERRRARPGGASS